MLNRREDITVGETITVVRAPLEKVGRVNGRFLEENNF